MKQHTTNMARYTPWIIFGSIILLFFIFIANIFGWVIGWYNGAIIGREDAKTQWHNIMTEEQRRADLVLNMANVVSGFGQHEHDTLVDTIRARSAGLTNTAVGDTGSIDTLGQAIAKLMVLFEQYPDIKAMPMYQDLNNELKNTENRIQIARTDYNGVARNFNIHIQKFPGTILAGIFNFEELSYFEEQEGSNIAPVVNVKY